MITRLPHWNLSNIHPAFNDLESLTAVEMVSRLYAKMQELVDSYNKYVDEMNKAIDDFESGIIADQDTFKAHIDKIMHDYISMLDEKIKTQDAKLENAVESMTTNIQATAEAIIGELISSGNIGINTSYDDVNETLKFVISNGGDLNE